MHLADLYKNAAVLFTMYNLINLTIGKNSDWYDLLLKKILSEPQIYQITLFSSEKSRAGVNDFKKTIHEEKSRAGVNELNSIFKKTIHQIPTVSIDLANVGTIADYEFYLPIFRNPRPSTLYVIFHHDESSSYLQSIIKSFVESTPTPTRPKCLLVSFVSSRESARNDSEIDWKELLRYAWSLKFLDFTLLRVTDDDQPIFFEEYNPFFGTFSHTDLSFGKFIFPDKMRDMNGFVLSVPFTNYPPHSYEKNGTRKRVGYDHETAHLISRTLNYKMKIVRYDNLPGHLILEKLKASEVNATDYTFFIGVAMHKRNAIRSTSYMSDYIVVVVPIRSSDSSSLTVDVLAIFIYVSFSWLMTICIVFVAMLFKFTSGLWTAFYVIQIMMGAAVERKPKACIERIVYLTITMISFVYLTDSVAHLTDKVVTKKDAVQNSLEELRQPSLPIYINKLYFRPDMYDNNDELKTIAKNVKGYIRSLHCALENVERQDRICIIPLEIARYVIATHRNADMSPILKVIEPPLFYDFAAFAFERASPFVEKFDQILCRIVESGILLKLMDQEMHSKALVQNATNTSFDNTNSIASLDLIVILMIGFLGSTVVFIAEVVVKAIKG